MKRLLLLLPAVLIGAQANAAITAYWNFDADFTATQGGSSFDMTAVNGATAGTATGKFGKAADFARASSQYAITTGNVMSGNGVSFSYSAWFNYTGPDIPNTSDRYFVLETSNSNTVGAATGGYFASVGLRDQSPVGGDEIQFFSNTSGLGSTIPGAGAITGWQNIVVTYQATTATTGTFNAYLNGTAITGITNLAYTQAVASVESLVIGGHRSGTGRNFQGQIDDVAFFDTVLTSTQIANLQTMTAAAAVPEPSAALLGGLGMLALMRRRRIG